MRRANSSEPSSFGRETTVRMTRVVSEALDTHMRQDDRNEQMAFGLANHAKTAEGTIFLIDELVLPERDDLAEQSAGGVCPTKECLCYVYYLAQRAGKSIVEFHTHPGGGVPRFSGVDEVHAYPNAEYIASKLSEPTTLVMIVGNDRFDAFDGIVFDRHRHCFRQLDRFEILGRPNDIRVFGELTSQMWHEHDAAYDRQQRIPGWNQWGLEQQRVGIFGAGGNGSPLFQTLLGIGAGQKGFIALVDHDHVEPSNLPRIPYAYPEHIGVPKVTVAAQYAGRKSPGTPVFTFPCRFNEKPVLDRMKTATVLFHCGDNDGGRKEVNEFAVRYAIPLIDLGCDIQVTDNEVIAGGQIRVILPGQTPCLVCCRGYDPAQAALDQMGDIDRAHHAAQGYVQGAEGSATPSVANLNGLTVQNAISQFLALVNGGDFAKWDYLHFDQFTGRTLAATSSWQVACPLCGQTACIAKGDPQEERTTPPRTPVKLQSFNPKKTRRQRRRRVNRNPRGD